MLISLIASGLISPVLATCGPRHRSSKLSCYLCSRVLHTSYAHPCFAWVALSHVIAAYLLIEWRNVRGDTRGILELGVRAFGWAVDWVPFVSRPFFPYDFVPLLS